jgi:hypothetical protein
VRAKKLLAGKRELPELILATGYPALDLLASDRAGRPVKYVTPRTRSRRRCVATPCRHARS